MGYKNQLWCIHSSTNGYGVWPMSLKGTIDDKGSNGRLLESYFRRTVVFDKSSYAVLVSTAQFLAWSHNTAAGVNLMVVCVSTVFPTGPIDVDSVTYNNIGMTRTVVNSDPYQRVEVWYLKNPASGSHQVQVNFHGWPKAVCGAITLKYVDMDDPLAQVKTYSGVVDNVTFTFFRASYNIGVGGYLGDPSPISPNLWVGKPTSAGVGSGHGIANSQVLSWSWITTDSTLAAVQINGQKAPLIKGQLLEKGMNGVLRTK